ncbi:MAG: F0F1 ATP synthase subunit delta [bacterium]
MKANKLGQILFLATQGKNDEEKQKMVKNLVKILEKKRRTYFLFQILKEFRKCLKKKEVTLTLSREATKDFTEEIKNGLKNIFSQGETFKIVINKNIISGFTARGGDYLVDASIKGLLRKFKNQATKIKIG